MVGRRYFPVQQITTVDEVFDHDLIVEKRENGFMKTYHGKCGFSRQSKVLHSMVKAGYLYTAERADNG